MARKSTALTVQDKNTALAMSGAHRGRITALVGQVIDEFDKRKKRGSSDIVALIADEIETGPRGPIAGLKELLGLLPPLPPEQAQAGASGALASLAGVFAGAAAAAAGAAAVASSPDTGDVIDVTPTRVQAGASDSQAIDW
jgi:hypothetical protein